MTERHMDPNGSYDSKKHDGVMVSSTFVDLEQHRAALMDALRKQTLFSESMEDYVARPDDDVISSSLRMVRDSRAYICLIGRRCGQCPPSPAHNPNEVSITRLEFEEAQRLKRPTLVFVMSDAHAVKWADIDVDPEKIKKLEEFRKHAKTGRIYIPFDNLEDFSKKAIHAVSQLRRYIDELDEAATQTQNDDKLSLAGKAPDPPAAPAFHAEPDYLGSHEFVGRKSELETLDEWALPADAHPVLLFEAIGGMGKSMLTWHWVKHNAERVRADWAGRYWYSFYERGAMMADFVRHALAYIDGVAPETLNKRPMSQLAEELLRRLRERPYLIVLDGLERVLVAYNRYDAAQLADDRVDQADDPIARRDPCAAIRPEDDDFLRKLTAVAPSKLLISSRLTPSSLLNPSHQAIPGVLRQQLKGLRPADAEALLKSQGVRGDSTAIQAYLKSNCDCHPLVTGVLAGLVHDYLPDRGNFDRWAADAGPNGGVRLNLADLDLKQRKSHILQAAIEALAPKSRRLLSTLALISQAVDYETLVALNPHIPCKHERSTHEMRRSNAGSEAALVKTIQDLERRGLIQYDANARRHDLHPVVRSVVSGELKDDEKNRYGQSVIDYFNTKPHNPYKEAETFADVEAGVQVVRTLIQMGRMEEAADEYRGDLAKALLINLDAHAESLSLLRPFFPEGWGTPLSGLRERDASYLCNSAGNSLGFMGDLSDAIAAYVAGLHIDLATENWTELRTKLSNIAITLNIQNRLARMERFGLMALELASTITDTDALFRARLIRFAFLRTIGRQVEAQAFWELLDPMGRNWPRNVYRPGEAEYEYAQLCFERGDLREEQLTQVEELARNGKNRRQLREIHSLRGEERIERGEWARAAESLAVAVRMAREVSELDTGSETLLALAQFHLGALHDPSAKARRLESLQFIARRPLAELWLAMGDRDQAVKHAHAAYKWAWADGEPYVYRYELNKSAELLTRLGKPIPQLPPYDPTKDPPFEWEAKVEAAIARLKKKKAKKEQAEKEKN